MSSIQFFTSETYFQREDVVQEYASFDFLLPPEQKVLEELGSRLPGASMLDIGVGGGRTAVHFMDRVARYVGIDVSPPMIRACRERFADRSPARVSFLVRDALDLREFEEGGFDLALFAFLGMDSILEREERKTVLRGVHRILSPGGLFAFSSENLDFLRDTLSYPRSVARAARGPGGRRSQLRRLPRLFQRLRRSLLQTRSLRRVNPELLSGDSSFGRYVRIRPAFELSPSHYEKARERIVIDGSAVTPSEQVAQLTEVGFSRVRLLDPDGRERTLGETEALRGTPWLYYLCAKDRGTGATAT
jgi:SAM-dependent methyltransferase